MTDKIERSAPGGGASLRSETPRGVKTIGDLEKAIEEMKYALHEKEGNDDDPDWYVVDYDRVLEKIGEVKIEQEKPIERAKQTLGFLDWLIREVEADYPSSERLLADLNNVRFSIDLFIAGHDTKKILGDDESG